LRRNSVAKANGFTALEWVKENPRQTPFAKCTVSWFAPIRAGDTVTSTARVIEKYERRGNKFVTFHVEAVNQRNVKVAEYDYTCIFEYAKGQKTQ
jgi:acyl dehydratase